MEGIRDATIKGKEGDEKAFVRIERRYGYVNPGPDGGARREDERISEEDTIKRVWEGDQAAVVERRDLVFLRARGDVKAGEDIDERVVKRMATFLLLERSQLT